ncbi:MAG: hypothetical protein QOJ34_841, partial [Pseudonocardiales bacterium]|nr:hypothetical protein [Pseudonocardiales bacterium]
IPDDAMKRIDEILGDSATRDPELVKQSTPDRRAV